MLSGENWMNVLYEYSHLGGSEILSARYPELQEEIYQVIEKVDARPFMENESSSRPGKLPHPPEDVKNQFVYLFGGLGYREPTEMQSVTIPRYITEIRKVGKQADFVKDKTAIEVQYSESPFMFYDMAVFQYFYERHLVDIGVEIIPCYFFHQELSPETPAGERFIADLDQMKQRFPVAPVKVIFVDAD
jgi:hypothetical protein